MLRSGLSQAYFDLCRCRVSEGCLKTVLRLSNPFINFLVPVPVQPDADGLIQDSHSPISPRTEKWPLLRGEEQQGGLSKSSIRAGQIQQLIISCSQTLASAVSIHAQTIMLNPFPFHSVPFSLPKTRAKRDSSIHTQKRRNLRLIQTRRNNDGGI
ncbi:hypothetical protein VTH06DRAFT_5054 [Thermothelomyces fergusii]